MDIIKTDPNNQCHPNPHKKHPSHIEDTNRNANMTCL